VSAARRLVAVLLALLLAAPAAAQLLISKEAFTRQFARALRAEAPGMKVTVKGELELEVKDASGKEMSAYLDNAYALYSSDPKARKEVIQRYVRSLLESAGDPDMPVDRARIVPVVKDRAWLAEVRRAAQARGGKPAEHVFEALNEDLVVVYAQDTPHNIRYLSADDVSQLGLRKGELRALAVANLRRLLPGVELRRGALLSMIRAGGDYEASLLLFDDIWSGGKLEVDGEVVVAIPARDLLLFTGSRSRDGIAKLRQVAAQASREASYSLTDRLFVYRNGRFERYE
jgi:uncharacterized protein YtpQ (UPF0354 family)